MPESLLKIYKTLDAQEQQEVYDFTMYLVSKKNAGKTDSKNHLRKFFGAVSEEDSKIMLEAVNECRRIEPDEW